VFDLTLFYFLPISFLNEKSLFVQYDVKDLLEFCDVNLHQAATEANAQEILKVAKRHRLLQAEEKIRYEFK